MVYRFFCLCVVALYVMVGGGAMADGARGIDFPSLSGDEEVVIRARHGIEWRRDERRYIARGDASVRQGDKAIYADMLTLIYREESDTMEGGMGSIKRLEAEGHVRIETASERAMADKGTYDVMEGKIMLTGESVSIHSGALTMHAKNHFTYWRELALGVAEGDASVQKGDAMLQGDVLVAEFLQEGDRATGISMIEAYGNVRVSDAAQHVRGKQGTYHVERGLADIMGDVEIVYGRHTLRGEHAQFDFDKGVSRLVAGAPADDDTLMWKKRARAVIQLDDPTLDTFFEEETQ
ncbi:MAG: hypothetical protein GDA54_04180 [Alphaproteobacteria bacterium GM7ARS4]|nr:hypothetical protein [Alphaproteobacteria bacterium GM7ARS4]